VVKRGKTPVWCLTHAQTKREWLVLDEYAGWHQWGLNRGERTYDRTASFEISCLLVWAGERDKLIKALSGRIIHGDRELPLLDIPKDGYVGEYCWHPMFLRLQFTRTGTDQGHGFASL